MGQAMTHRNVVRRRWAAVCFWLFIVAVPLAMTFCALALGMGDEIVQVWPVWASSMSTATIIVLAYLGFGHQENRAEIQQIGYVRGYQMPPPPRRDVPEFDVAGGL